MKKQRNIVYVGTFLFLLFLVVSVLTFEMSNNQIEKGYLASEGSAAENFAVLTASNIHLSDAQVEKLKNYSYAELQSSEENEMLRSMMSNDSFASKVDYAYIMVQLPSDQVKYSVDETNKDFFDAPTGTPLDIMWLLDVNVSDEADSNTDSSAISAQDELRRYSYYIDEDAQIFAYKPSYIYNASEWGDHICGYAPLYSTEGTYIGAVGVELQTHSYNVYRRSAMWAMAALLVVSTLTLSLLFFYLYRKYKKLQYERIYTDSLTGIYNRSYYNNRFIKQMNGEHKNEPCFALMIGDVDWFKKVNDTFGHEIGDEVLMEISAILVETFGRMHVSRFGGEEFVVGLWLSDETTLQTQLDSLFARIANTKFSKQQIDLSISMGCCYSMRKELSGWLLSGMLKAADTNLYAVKENGRKAYHIIRYEDAPNYEEDKT